MTSSYSLYIYRDRQRIADTPRTYTYNYVLLHKVQATRNSCVASPALLPLHYLVYITKKNVRLATHG